MHRGDIIHIQNFTFHTGEQKDKFIVVLSDTDALLDIIFVFTTSRVAKYQNISEDIRVMIPA